MSFGFFSLFLFSLSSRSEREKGGQKLLVELFFLSRKCSLGGVARLCSYFSILVTKRVVVRFVRRRISLFVSRGFSLQVGRFSFSLSERGRKKKKKVSFFSKNSFCSSSTFFSYLWLRKIHIFVSYMLLMIYRHYMMSIRVK